MRVLADTRRQLASFCLALGVLLLISLAPAFACPGCISYVSIVPFPMSLGMAGSLALSALLYEKRRILTVFLFIGCYILLLFISGRYWVLYFSELKVLASIPFLIVINLIYLFSDDEKEKYRRIFSGVSVGLVVLGIALVIHQAGTSTFLFTGHFTRCQSNLRNIGTALDMYLADNKGKYPDTLVQISPVYMKKIPRCYEDEVSDRTREYVKKMYGKTIDDYKYTVSADHKKCTVWCSGKNHSRITGYPGYPQYNSEQGLINGK